MKRELSIFEKFLFVLAAGVLLLGVLGLLGFYLRIPFLRALSVSNPEMALATAYGITFVGISLVLGLRQKIFSKERKNIIENPYYYLLAALTISGFHIATALIKENFDLIKLFSVGVEGYMSFLSAVCLLVCSVGIFFYFYKSCSPNISFFGIGFPGLLLVNVNLYAWAGYLYNIPLLYNNKMALSSSIGYFAVGAFLLAASTPNQGLFFPLIERKKSIVWATALVLFLGYVLLIDGIFDMVRLDSVVRTTNLIEDRSSYGYLYLFSSLSSIVLSILITAIGMKAIHYYLDLKRAENKAEEAMLALEDMNQTLENRVAERTEALISSYKALETALTQLREKEKQRQMFVTAIAHDLKTPLIAQKRILESLTDDLQDDADAFHLAQGSLNNNNNLLTMVNKVLEAYQYEEGKIELKLEPLNIKLLVEECLGDISSLIKSKDLQVFNKISSQLPLVLADRTQIKRVFQNLIGNAIEHAPIQGFINLNSMVDEKVKILVSDNGPGINPEIRPYLFNQYLMGAKKQKIGSGLGLFISRFIIEMHNGTIDFQSEPGRGATFSVSLPRMSEGLSA